MTAGGVYSVTVTMKNTGNTTWTSGAVYALGSRNPYDNSTWGGGRAALPGDIGPGGFAQFSFQVTAPSAAGSYNFQWAMVQDGVEWFGSTSDNVVVNVTAPAPLNGAQAVAMSVPSLTQGQSAVISVTMLNTGNTTWTAGANYKLGSKNPDETAMWGVQLVELTSAVAPGQQYTFTFPITAPAAGNYTMQWQMMQRYVQYFGALASTAVIVNAPAPVNGAQPVAISVPPLAAGQVANISVTMQNTGNTTWTTGANYKLGSENPDETTMWGVQLVELHSAVAPGQQYTFTFPITAPAAGNYTMQWQMMERYVQYFGGLASTPVTIGAAGDVVTYIHTDALGSPVARSDSAGTVISRTSYEPYGRTASGGTLTIGFTGHVNDADTGLVYMQQRYYDPVAGRFLSVDPVMTDANDGKSFNRYVYANNSPFLYRDPDGRAIESIDVDKNNNVHIVVGITYKGAISPDQVASLNTAIAHQWSGKFGKYAVNVTIIPGSQAKYANIITVVDGKGRSETAGNGARTGVLYTKEADGDSMSNAMAHELGHLFGMSTYPFDKYTLSVPFPGWEGNIMAEKGGKVEERNITDLIKFGRAYLGANENINTGSESKNVGPQGCMAAGGDCWH